MTFKKLLGVGGLFAATTLVLGGCASAEPGPSSTAIVGDAEEITTESGLVIDGELIADEETYEIAQTQTLSLYTGFPEVNEATFIEAFTHDTGIAVEFVRLQPNRLSERVLSEQGAGLLGADVVRISDYVLASGLGNAGVWDPYVVPGTESLDEVSIDGGDFTRAFNAVYVFGYNTELVSEDDAPTSWRELVDPRWTDQIGIVHGGSGGGSAALSRFMELELGPEYFAEYAALNPTIYEGVGPQQTALARGEIAVGTVAPAAINAIVTADNAPVTFVVPEDGVVTFDYYVGITSAAENREAAEVFMNYNLSSRGQQVFTALGDYSVRPDVAPPSILGKQLPSIDSGDVWRMTIDQVELSPADASKWNEVFGY